MKKDNIVTSESKSNQDSNLMYQVMDSKERRKVESSGQIDFKPDNYIVGYRIVQNLNADNYLDLEIDPMSKILSLVDKEGGIIANLEITESSNRVIHIAADNSTGNIYLNVGDNARERLEDKLNKINLEQTDDEASSVATTKKGA